MTPKKQKILFTRTDRLGDVLLSLPSVAYLRRSVPDAEIHFLCHKPTAEILSPLLASWNIIVLNYEASLDTLVDQWKEQCYQAALFLFSEKTILKAGKLSGIPMRVGIYSKPSSFFYLTDGLAQRRSFADKNEAEYNLELTQLLVDRLNHTWHPPTSVPICLPTIQQYQNKARELVQQLGVKGPFICVHPGMGGSALNLSSKRYLSLIHYLEKTTAKPVLVTIGPSEEDQRKERELLSGDSSLKIIRISNLPTLMELFRMADQVLAPSTGPLHLAHYVGTPTYGLFSPLTNQRKERWGPYGGSGQSQALSPNLSCPADKSCLNAKCSFYPCMDQTQWEQALASIEM